ncbi:DUF551 domain-containing protein [Cronobacter sakazakii]|uniref:DUF551 domain-containing protein n=1 Tax=Cronobacter sakazakii TaxID=28141 RepID=UPI000CFBF1A8|nr:DUF551 domain-containing protein [Cronobacter sakazakii]HAU5500079.1 DUF551 domain-containing protein [Cronobacter sakazakii]
MSTISNERLEKLSEYDCADRYEVMSMATELLALRKEREKEESAVCPKCGNTGLADSGGVQPWGEPILIECDCTAPPAPDIADDSLPYDPQIAEYEQMMEAEQAQADTTSQQCESLAGKAVSGWIPCSERLPDLKQEILCVNQWGEVEAAIYDVGYIPGEPFFATSAGEFYPTHWHALPELPCK